MFSFPEPLEDKKFGFSRFDFKESSGWILPLYRSDKIVGRISPTDQSLPFPQDLTNFATNFPIILAGGEIIGSQTLYPFDQTFVTRAKKVFLDNREATIADFGTHNGVNRGDGIFKEVGQQLYFLYEKSLFKVIGPN